MRNLLVLLFACWTVVLAADISEEHKAAIRATAMQCMQQAGSTKEQAMALRQGVFEGADAKAKCFANCFLERAGFIVDGQIKADAVLEKLGPTAGADQVRAALASCKSVKDADKCENGFQIYQCLHKNQARV